MKTYIVQAKFEVNVWAHVKATDEEEAERIAREEMALPDFHHDEMEELVDVDVSEFNG